MAAYNSALVYGNMINGVDASDIIRGRIIALNEILALKDTLENLIKAEGVN